jgi:tetratricopeptide (TPR) repeat protein
VALLAAPGCIVLLSRITADMTRFMTLGLALSLLTHAGCMSRVQNEPDLAEIERNLPSTLLLADYPLSPVARPTTSADILLAHLSGQITEAERAQRNTNLAGLLFQRYQIVGHTQDLDRAYELAKAAGQAPNANDQARLIWATIAAHVHEFSAAESALQQISPSMERARLRLQGQIQSARGQTLKVAQNAALPEGGEFDWLLTLANQCVDQGDLHCATKYYHQAQFFDHDTAPMTLAWLHTLQGIALLRFGHPDWALRFFDAALARVPNYYLAAEHRAECLSLTGQYAAAGELYLKVIMQTGGEENGNPEFMAALAGVLMELGESAEAERWQTRAEAAFAKRIARYPNAYASHAIDFYLERKDYARARDLATNNLRIRQDVGSWISLAEVERAAQVERAFCHALDQAVATGWNPPELVELRSSAAAARCKR